MGVDPFLKEPAERSAFRGTQPSLSDILAIASSNHEEGDVHVDGSTGRLYAWSAAETKGEQPTDKPSKGRFVASGSTAKWSSKRVMKAGEVFVQPDPVSLEQYWFRVPDSWPAGDAAGDAWTDAESERYETISEDSTAAVRRVYPANTITFTKGQNPQRYLVTASVQSNQQGAKLNFSGFANQADVTSGDPVVVANPFTWEAGGLYDVWEESGIAYVFHVNAGSQDSAASAPPDFTHAGGSTDFRFNYPNLTGIKSITMTLRDRRRPSLNARTTTVTFTGDHLSNRVSSGWTVSDQGQWWRLHRNLSLAGEPYQFLIYFKSIGNGFTRVSVQDVHYTQSNAFGAVADIRVKYLDASGN